MIGSCNDSTHPFAKTLCSICYEDLKPIVEDLQAISICGHVFHELCIQQWFEYCSKGKKKCPICKQTCSAANVSRLYFQSLGDLNGSNLSQKLKTHKEDTEELKFEVKRLEGKISKLSLALESRENDLNNLKNELSVCKEQLKIEKSLKKEAMDQNDTINSLLKLKTQELNKSKLKLVKLQESKEGLAKELAALKLVSDLDSKDDKIGKFASFGTEPHNKENVDRLVKCLVAHNRDHKELMTKYKTLGMDDACSREELEKAKEKLKDLEKLKKKLLKLETAREVKENEVLRDPKASKKIKDSLNDTFTPQDTINEPDVHLRKPKRLKVTENIIKSTSKDGTSSCIIIDDDDDDDDDDAHAPKVSTSLESPSYDSALQPTNRAKTNDDVAFVHKIKQDKHLSNITNESSLPALSSQKAAEVCFTPGLLGPDGTGSYLGKWCKRGQNKGSKASSILTQSNGSTGSLFSARSSKLGVKTSSLQSEAGLRIGHFFSKAGQ